MEQSDSLCTRVGLDELGLSWEVTLGFGMPVQQVYVEATANTLVRLLKN